MKIETAIAARRRREVRTEHTHEVQTDLAQSDRDDIARLQNAFVQGLEAMAAKMRALDERTNTAIELCERLGQEAKIQNELTDANIKRRA